MSCAHRIHENPLGDEGITKLVSGMIALHGATMPVAPDAMTDRPGKGNTIASEPESGSDVTSGDYVASNNAVNGDAINQTSGKVNLLSLKSLEIGACGITAASASAVADLIRANMGITALSVTGNKDIESHGWAEIAESLENNSVINVLELHHNALENTSASLIADGLARNTSIRTVDLEGNHIGDEGADKILKMLEVNRTLQTIYLRNGNGMSESVLADIERLTEERQHLSSAT